MTDDSQQLSAVERTESSVAEITKPTLKLRGKRAGRILLAAIAFVALAFAGKVGYEWYLSTVNCTPAQLVEKHWNFLDTATRLQMAQTAGTFLLKNTQRPVLVLSETAGLRPDYLEAPEPSIICKEPEPPLMCSFTGGACNRSTSGLASAGAKYYLVAYLPGTAPELDMNPERTILEQFTENLTLHQVQKLTVTVVAPTDIQGQALQALIPGGYGNTIKTETKHFVSQSAGMYPTVIDFKHYDGSVSVSYVMQDTDVLLLDEKLTIEQKTNWISSMLDQGYQLYMYPAPEIYTFPIQS